MATLYEHFAKQAPYSASLKHKNYISKEKYYGRKNILTYNLSKLSKVDSSNLNRIINKKVKNPKVDRL